jgi:hypothetical protein
MSDRGAKLVCLIAFFDHVGMDGEPYACVFGAGGKATGRESVRACVAAPWVVRRDDLEGEEKLLQ